MANETEITIRGNTGGGAAIHEGPNGGVAVRFTVAVSTARYNQSEGAVVHSEPQWFTVKCFGALGRNTAQSIVKGTPVLVRGELVTEHWQDNSGQARSAQVVRADTVAIALNNGTANYVKVIRDSAVADATDNPEAAPRNVSGLAEAEDYPEEEPREEEEREEDLALAGAPAKGSPF